MTVFYRFMGKIRNSLLVGAEPNSPARIYLFAAVLIAVFLGGCAQLGPKVLVTGRPLYNVAVQQTEAQQLLLNIVRQRYNDPIMFLDVTSISSSFSREASAGLLGTFGHSGSNSVAGTLGATFSENPFISYAPNTGEKFVRQMLKPLDLNTVVLVVQAGWSVERILLIIGNSINQLRNSPSGDEPARSGYLKYQQVAAALRDLQRDGQLSMGAESTADKKKDPGLSLLIAAEAKDSEPYRQVCESIEVACDGKPLKLRQAVGMSSDGHTLALSTRSLFSAMYFLSQGVEVPAEDAAAGVASRSISGGPFDLHGPGDKLFHVRSSSVEPELASVKIFYRNSWFYIADNDMDSKVTFALVSMLVMLQSGETAKVTPLITLPAG